MTIDSSSVLLFCKKLLQSSDLRDSLASMNGNAISIQELAESKGCIISSDAAEEIYRWSTGKPLLFEHSDFSIFSHSYPTRSSLANLSRHEEGKPKTGFSFESLAKDDYILSGDFELELLDLSLSENHTLVYVLVKVVEQERESFKALFDPGDLMAIMQADIPDAKRQDGHTACNEQVDLIKASYWRRSLLAVWKLPSDIEALEAAFMIPYYEWSFSEENPGIATIKPTSFVYGESCKGRGIEYLISDSKGVTREVKPQPLEEYFDENAEIISYKLEGDGEPPFRVGILRCNNGLFTHTDFLDCNLASFDGSDDELFEAMRKWLFESL